MKQFVPVTDELIDEPNLPSHWQLVPYQVDHHCFRWSVCTEQDVDEHGSENLDGVGQARRLLRASGRLPVSRPQPPQGAEQPQR